MRTDGSLSYLAYLMSLLRVLGAVVVLTTIALVSVLVLAQAWGLLALTAVLALCAGLLLWEVNSHASEHLRGAPDQTPDPNALRRRYELALGQLRRRYRPPDRQEDSD